MSRIIAICDSYDAITNDRPYRKAQSRDCALGEIAACAGTQFDPGLAAQFIRLFSPEEKSVPSVPGCESDVLFALTGQCGFFRTVLIKNRGMEK
jgi:HD-GYP domain-containing protein (c-di-GMP phosphodiesterase class II)